MRAIRTFMLAAVFLAGGLADSGLAATVGIAFKSFARADAAQAILERDGFIGSGRILAEDFELGYLPCTNDNYRDCSAGTILSSQLGSFSGFGKAINDGASQVRPKSKIVVRSAQKGVAGRYNVTPGGSNWLDSNDREGITWSMLAPGGLDFRRIAFFLTDLDDVGQVVFNISVNGGQAVSRPATQPGGNGRLHLITMLFDDPVNTFSMRMVNGAGDGFGLDGIRIAAVPLPAAGLMLLASLGGLAMLARRNRGG